MFVGFRAHLNIVITCYNDHKSKPEIGVIRPNLAIINQLYIAIL